jgi:hypothetical protein
MYSMGRLDEAFHQRRCLFLALPEHPRTAIRSKRPQKAKGRKSTESPGKSPQISNVEHMAAKAG